MSKLFNMSKKAIAKREELKRYSDKKIEDIALSITLKDIFSSDIATVEELLHACFTDLTINRDLGRVLNYLDEVRFYLDIEILEELLNEKFLCDIAKKEVEKKVKGFYQNEIILTLAKQYVPFAKSTSELHLVLAQVRNDSLSKMYTLLNMHLKEEICSIYESYESLFELRRNLINEIDRVFGIDREAWLNEQEAEEVLEDAEKYSCLFSFRELESLALDNGYVLDRVNGSHHIYKKEDRTIVIPRHNKDLGKGIASKIQKDIRNDK